MHLWVKSVEITTYYLWLTSMLNRARYTKGVSIGLEGWMNMKNHPLINVIASNNGGSMFLYADDFLELRKLGKT